MKEKESLFLYSSFLEWGLIHLDQIAGAGLPAVTGILLGFTSRQLKTANFSVSETREKNQKENPKMESLPPKQDQEPSQAVADGLFSSPEWGL